MGEKNLNFDQVVDRKNTLSVKYDFAQEYGFPTDTLPLWVADMDFKVSSYITEAMEKLVQHEIFGYCDVKEYQFEPVKDWMKRHYNWEPKGEWVVRTPSVVFALAMAVQTLTREGEAVIIQQPVYYPFSNVVRRNRRKLVVSELVQDENGVYRMNYEDFEEKLVRENVKLFLLCSPHNPVGRVWTREELERIGDICMKHNVWVVSDEIHADFAFKRPHTVFLDIKEAYKDRSIVCTAPSKTFNIAGLQLSNIFIPNDEIRSVFQENVYAAGYSCLATAGLVACEAAYRHGEEWYRGVTAYIHENIEFTRRFVEERLPKVIMTEPEGTYLVWLDFRKCGFTDEELNEKVLKEAKLWLDAGNMFGPAGEGFQRINVACPRVTLTQALERLAKVFG